LPRRLTYGAREAILTAINTIEPATGRQLLQQALTDKDWALRLRRRRSCASRGPQMATPP
jgi:hypothetical protein